MAGPYPVTVSVDGPLEHRNRMTVFFRPLLAIPHLLLVGPASWLHRTGAAGFLGGWIGEVARADPFWSLVVLYASTVVLTELITNNAAGVLMFPIAMAVANEAGAHYLPFVIVVMVGASAGFITPIGYQTNLMVYGPGGYRYMDYVRFGVPLSILVGIATVLIVPRIWSF